MTEFIIIGLLLFGIGVLVGRLFWKLNPFLMLFGIFVGAPMFAQALVMNVLYAYVMVFGVLFGLYVMHKRNGGAGLRFLEDFSITGVLDFLSSFRMRGEAERFRKQQEQEDHAYEHYQQYRDHAYEQAKQKEEQAKSREQQANQNSSRAKQQQEDIHKQWEQFKKAKQKFEDEKSQYDSPQDDTRSPYEILGVSMLATPDEVKKAYKKRASQYHPDKYSHMSPRFRKEAEAELKKINNAYETLMGKGGGKRK